jgi:SAM-dependent methyltransferase
MTSSDRTIANPAGVRIDDTPQTFWDRIYAGKTKPTGGRPSLALTRFIEGRPKGHALDLGCARGDDAIWLAQQGWTVTGVDISEAALQAARLAATAQGVQPSVHFERHDLAESFPQGAFDLVTAMFLQSPVPFGRTKALRRAAQAVEAGGLLLVVTHGSRHGVTLKLYSRPRLPKWLIWRSIRQLGVKCSSVRCLERHSVRRANRPQFSTPSWRSNVTKHFMPE